MELKDALQENDYYDETLILQKAGITDPLHITFALLYGPPPLEEPYASLLAEARAHNAGLHAARRTAQAAEARALMQQPDPWPLATWQRLSALGYATVGTPMLDEADHLHYDMDLTLKGEQLWHEVCATIGSEVL